MVRVTTSKKTEVENPVRQRPHNIMTMRSNPSNARHFKWRCVCRTMLSCSFTGASQAKAGKKSGDNLESSAIDLNVIDQVKILERSPLFKKRVADGSLKIVGARYNLESGKVEIINSGD